MITTSHRGKRRDKKLAGRRILPGSAVVIEENGFGERIKELSKGPDASLLKTEEDEKA